MKISRKDSTNNKITAAEELEVSKYSQAVDYIYEAIAALAESAEDDDIAGEAIANLSVVLVDLDAFDEDKFNEASDSDTTE